MAGTMVRSNSRTEMILRDYQKQVSDSALVALQTEQRIVVSCPTGSGKTAIAIYGLLPNLPKRVAWVTHRTELAGQVRSMGAKVKVFMVQKEITGRHDVIVIDEGHHVCADQYRRIIEAYPNAKVIALTATPYRLDGVGLGSCGFSRIILGPDAYELTESGVLCPARFFVPKSEQLSSWTPAATAQRITRLKFSKGIAFCRSVEEAERLAKLISMSGIKAASIDGLTSDDKRARLFRRFQNGEIRVMCNHSIFTEGMDVPDVDLVVLNRHTLSRCLWKQMIGRGTRQSPGKTQCTVLDLAANAVTHGSIYDKEIHDLDGSVEFTESRTLSESPEREIREYEYNEGEELKEWKPSPKPIRIIESLQRLRSRSPLLKLRTA